MPNQYYVNRNDKVRGPFSEERIRELHANGKLKDSDFVSTRNDGGWETVATMLTRHQAAGRRGKPTGRIQFESAVSNSRKLLWIGVGITFAVIVGFGVWLTFFGRPDPEQSQTQRPVITVAAPSETLTLAERPVTVPDPDPGTVSESATPKPDKVVTESENSHFLYQPGQQFTIADGELRFVISTNSEQTELRVLACVLDFLVAHVGYRVEMMQSSPLDSGEQFIPSDRFHMTITPPDKAFFSDSRSIEYTWPDVGPKELAQSIMKNFALQAFAATEEKPGDIGLLRSMKRTVTLGHMQAAIDGDAAAMESIRVQEDAYSNHRTKQLGRFAAVIDKPRTPPASTYDNFGRWLCLLMYDAVFGNEIRLIRERKPGVEIDLQVLNEIIEAVRDPLNTSRPLQSIDTQGPAEASQVAAHTFGPWYPEMEAALARIKGRMSPMGQGSDAEPWIQIYVPQYRELKLPEGAVFVGERISEAEFKSATAEVFRLLPQVTCRLSLFLTNRRQDYTKPMLLELARIPKLDTLSFTPPSVDAFDDDCCKSLANLRHLRFLDVGSKQITDEGVVAISKINTLVGLELADARLSSRGIMAIASMPNLSSLTLAINSLNDESLKALEGQLTLNVLRLRNCSAVTEKSLTVLKSISNLKELELHKTGISSATAKSLQQELAELVVGRSSTEVEQWLLRMLREPICNLQYPGETSLREPLIMLAGYYSDNFSPPGKGMYIVADPVSLKIVGLKSIDDLKIKDLNLGRDVPLRDALRAILDKVTEVKLDYEIRDDKIFITAEKRM